MNNKYKNIILLGVAALVFGFAQPSFAGMCDQYEVVPTCMGSGPGSTANFSNNYGNTWGPTNPYPVYAYNNNNNYNYVQPAPMPVPTQAYVTTKNPIQVGSYSINMNGSVSSNSPTTVYFQYGTTMVLGNETPRQQVGSMNGDVNSNVTGLIPNTTYYYRIVAENAYGRVNGNIVSITTSPVITTNVGTGTTTTKTTTVVKKSTPAPTPVVKDTSANTAQVYDSNLSANGLTALSLSGTNSFFPDTVFEWVIVFLLILAIIILIRQFRPRHGPATHAAAHH